MRGLACEEKKELEQAISDYSEAIRLDPNYAPAWLHRGAAWSIAGEYDKAVQDMNEAIRLKPDDMQALGACGGSPGMMQKSMKKLFSI